MEKEAEEPPEVQRRTPWMDSCIPNRNAWMKKTSDE
jgi:hypothetical protein